ncbi:MAG: DUF2486 family protein [Pararobbsia sp.]
MLDAFDAPAGAHAFELDDVPLLTDVLVDEAKAQVESRSEPTSSRPASPEPASSESILPEPASSESARSELREPPAAMVTSTHAPVDLSAVASGGDAHLFDSELPLRAYCSFPGDVPATPLDAGDSAVPPAYPMASVPSPFGSAEAEAEAEAARLESAGPDPRAESSVPPPVSLRAVIAPETADPSAVSVYPVPFEPIAETTLEEAADAHTSQAPSVAQASPDLTGAEVLEEGAVAEVGKGSAIAEASEDLTGAEVLDPEAGAAREALKAPTATEAPEARLAAEASQDLTGAGVLDETAPTEAPSAHPHTHGLSMAADEADHLAAMLSRQEPVAAELTLPQPEALSDPGGAPTQAEIDAVITDVRGRALRYLGGEGHALIESRCQEQAAWLAHRITREIAATLEREIGEWVQLALNEALEKRQARALSRHDMPSLPVPLPLG